MNRADPIKIALTVALLAIVLTLALDSEFYNSSMVDAFMAMALAGAAGLAAEWLLYGRFRRAGRPLGAARPVLLRRKSEAAGVRR